MQYELSIFVKEAHELFVPSQKKTINERRRLNLCSLYRSTKIFGLLCLNILPGLGAF